MCRLNSQVRHCLQFLSEKVVVPSWWRYIWSGASIKRFRFDLTPELSDWKIGHLEKFMSFNVVQSDSKIRLHNEYLLEQVTSCRIHHLSLIPDISLHYLLVDLHWIILILERNRPSEQLNHYDTETPQVSWVWVSFRRSCHDFRRSIANSATVCLAPLIILLQFTRKTEINQFYVTVLINHNVVRFQVPINNAIPVQEAHNSQYLSTKEINPILFPSFIELIILEELELKFILNHPFKCFSL